MATTASGVTIPGSSPTTTAATPIQDHWNNLGKSLNGKVIVPVASVTARAALVAALTAEGYTISASNPLYTHRADAPLGFELEVTVNGTSWRTVAPRAKTASGANVVSSSAVWVRTGDAPAVVGDGASVFKITLTLSAAFSTVTNDVGALAVIRPDGSVVFNPTYVHYLSGVWGHGTTLVVSDTPAAGSIVYGGAWQRITGTGTCTAQATQIIVEQIA